MPEYVKFKISNEQIKKDFETFNRRLKEREKREKEEDNVSIPISDEKGKILKVIKKDFINALDRKGYELFSYSKPLDFFLKVFDAGKKKQEFDDSLLVRTLRRRLEKESKTFDKTKGYRYEIPTIDGKYIFLSKSDKTKKSKKINKDPDIKKLLKKIKDIR